MKTIRANWVMALCLLAMVSCTKETEVIQESVSSAGDSKIYPPWIFLGGPFQVLSGFCPYGTIPSGLIDTDAFQSGTKNLVINEGSCTLDANNLILEAGATAGTYGPTYFIVPPGSFPPSGVSRLKIRVKNVSGSAYTDYNKEFSYDSSTNIWSWSVNASNYFDISTTTGIGRCL